MAKVGDESVERRKRDETFTWRVVAEEASKDDHSRRRDSVPPAKRRWLLFPDDPFVQTWGILMFLLLIFVAVSTPYRVALDSPDSVEWVALDTAIDAMFFMDLLLNCVLAYYDAEKNLITSHRTIFLNYAKSWFFLDLLACLPMQYLQGAGNYNSLVRLSRLPRLYRLVRMFRLMRMLKVLRHRASVMRYMTHVFRISIGMERLFWFSITLCFTLHLCACTWAFVGRFNMDNDPVNWITVKGYQDKANIELYIISVYWAITTVATVGYGDILATNNFERAMNSLIMLVGVLVYSYMVGAFTNVISSLDSRKAKLTRNLESLSELAKEYHLGKAFYSKLTNAIEYEHRNNNKEIDNLVQSLPTHLRTQLLILIHRKKIETNTFFEGRSQDFVAWIVPLLKSVLLDSQEYVYRQGDLAIEMYFLIKGEVDFIVNFSDVELSFVSMNAGYYFGELELVFSQNKLRLHTAKVKEKVELLTLTLKNFERLMKTFEMEGLEIVSIADERKKRMEKSQKEAIDAFRVKRRLSRKMSIPLDAKSRKTKALQYKKNMEMEAEASSQAEEISECKLSSSSDEESGSRFSSESVRTVTPVSCRPSSRRLSLLKAPIYERLTTKITCSKESEIKRLQRQVRALSSSLNDMRGLVLHLSKKFNLAKLEETPSPLMESKSMRKLSVGTKKSEASSASSSDD